jgi:hypothetical protein
MKSRTLLSSFWVLGTIIYLLWEDHHGRAAWDPARSEHIATGESLDPATRFA